MADGDLHQRVATLQQRADDNAGRIDRHEVRLGQLADSIDGLLLRVKRLEKDADSRLIAAVRPRTTPKRKKK